MEGELFNTSANVTSSPSTSLTLTALLVVTNGIVFVSVICCTILCYMIMCVVRVEAEDSVYDGETCLGVGCIIFSCVNCLAIIAVLALNIGIPLGCTFQSDDITCEVIVAIFLGMAFITMCAVICCFCVYVISQATDSCATPIRSERTPVQPPDNEIIHSRDSDSECGDEQLAGSRVNLLSPAAHERTSESPPREDFNHDVQKHHLPIVHVPEDFPCESDSLELRLLNTEQLQFTPVVSFPSSSLRSQNSSIEFDHSGMDTIQTGRITPPLLQTASESVDAPEGIAQTCFVLGEVHTLPITHQGGTFPLHPFGPRGGEQQVECCATLEAPPGVVGSGVTVSVHYAIILDGPFKFPEEWERTSVVLYIDCPEKRLLEELLFIKLRHWAVCQPDALAVMKADHTFTGVHEKDEFVFAQLNDFSDCQSFSDAVVFGLMDHFCLICIAMKCTRSANLSLNHTSCYLMKVPDYVEAAEFRIFLMYGVPSWIDAVQEYCIEEGRSGKLQKGVRKIVVSKPSVVLSITRQSGQGWSLWMSGEELFRDDLKYDHFCKLSHADKKMEMKNLLYPPSVECHIVYKETPREGVHEKNKNTLTISSGDNKAQFLITVWDRKLLPDVHAAPKQTASIGWSDNSHVNPQNAVHDRYYGEPSKPLTVQNLMPYINDLADEVVSIAGWLGMDGELSVITKTIGVTTPKERLQQLLKKWLEDTEHPTAPHTWENFVRVVQGVRKGHVADRILEDVFTGNGLPSDPVALEGYVVSKMADKWYQFGIHLGLSVETLRSLGDSKYIPDDPTRCLVMFRHWMKEVGPRENEMDIIQQAMKKVMKIAGDDMSRWMSSEDQQGEISSLSNDAIPNLEEKMADNWFNFGIALGLSKEELQSIEKSNDSNKARCSAMLYHWLKTGDQREKTHERLLRAAKKVTSPVATSGICSEPPTYSEYQKVDPKVSHYIFQT